MNALATETRWPQDLFVLHRQHWLYLNGEIREIEHSHLTSTERMILIGLIFFTLAITALTIYLSLMSLRLTEYGYITNAQIIEHGSKPNLPGISYFVVYAYTVDDQIYQGEQAVTRSIYQRLSRRGAIAEIAYMPDNPNISRLAGNNQIYTETSIAIFLTLLCPVLMAALFIRPWRTRQLARNGQILLGEIKTFRRVGANIHLRFTLLSPEGRRLNGIGSTTLHENDVYPTEGLPVAVLYLNENFYRML